MIGLRVYNQTNCLPVIRPTDTWRVCWSVIDLWK